MAVYCWGNTIHGELGLGGIEDELILTPREMTWPKAPDLSFAACGSIHTILLTKDGKVYSCGDNDHGQLGHVLSRKRPQPVDGLNNYVITQVNCGSVHSIALNEWGQVFSWGSDSCGQLGLDNGHAVQSIPKIIKVLATKHIVQIASGYSHCLALTNIGQLFSWGSNRYGQLGIGSTCEKVVKPTEIKSLAGIPIASIACGANHSFAISKSGAVFGWGKNTTGQLGLNDELSKSYPTQLKTLRSLGVRYISCGDDFSVFLTMDGGVFTCGSGTYGQLGHGVCANEILPRMVMELMGSTVTQITCGSRHTLALVASRGRVYGFGLGCSGQLGSRNTNNSLVPQVVLGPWVSPNGTALINNGSLQTSSIMIVKRIFSGGDHCFLSATEFSKNIPPEDFRQYDPKTQILTLTLDMAKACSQVPKDSSVDLDLFSSMESIFKSQACMNGSFLLPNDRHFCCTSKHHGVDITGAEDIFGYLRKIENDSLKQIIWDGVTNDLLNSLIPSPADVETLRTYIILPLYHEFVNAKNYLKLHSVFSQAIFKLSTIPAKIISEWWATSSTDYYEALVTNYKNVVLYIINFNFPKKREDNKKIIAFDPNLTLALNFLLFLHRINHQQRKDKVSYGIFHMAELLECVDIQQDYVQWIMDKNPHTFHLCNYPFLFNAEAKTLLLQTDQAIQMQSAMQNAATQGLYLMFTGSVGAISQFVDINVTRENLVQDTFREISQYHGASDLKKPLKVKFQGEEAEDAGGVRKEFFMLLLKDILDPKYGMFKEFEDSRAIWFSDHSFEAVEMYYLIGIICGLAIYNFTIIALPFPLALYKKLLKEPVDLSDLNDLSPILANSMKNILNYEEDDFEDVFGLNFQITRENFGNTEVVDLKPDGEKISVTKENRKEFVDLYVDFIFNKSVEKQFKAFYDGFMKVCGGRLLELFKAHELMAVVIGNEDYDWYALETEAEYKGGYTSGDQTIRWFWEVFHELPLSEKKKFLLYLTGSDRIPIQGMKAIKIIIQPTNDEKFLPVAHTCFNLLDLPKYRTKERLKYKLLQAIQQTQGFSLV